MWLVALLENHKTSNLKTNDNREGVLYSSALKLPEEYIEEQYKDLQKGYMKLLVDY